MPTPIQQAKPIVLVYFNHTIIPGKDISIVNEFQQRLETSWRDYHVLVIPEPSQKQVIRVQTWYDKSLREEDFKAFEKHVKTLLDKQGIKDATT